MNRTSDASGNPTISAERVLPWIQDTEQDDVWEQWNVTYRDVFIVNGAGELAGVYNLSINDLAVQDNSLALAQMIADTAALTDVDNDNLSDFWEQENFGDLTTASASNPDHLMSYAFGEALSPRSPHLELQMNREEDGLYFKIQFDARTGAAGRLAYQIEISEDGLEWRSLNVAVDSTLPPRPHYNGTAMQTYTFRSSSPMSRPAGFIRARADFPSL